VPARAARTVRGVPRPDRGIEDGRRWRHLLVAARAHAGPHLDDRRPAADGDRRRIPVGHQL